MKHSTEKTTSTPGFKPGHTANLLRDRIEKPDTLLHRLRAKLGISQAEMATMLNVHEDTVRRIESGKHQPNKWVAPMIEALAKRHKVQ